MKIAIENFGAIKKRIVIDSKPLTIFCGENNTGKTYALYVLNALMDNRFIADFSWSKKHLNELINNKILKFLLNEWIGVEAIKTAEKDISHRLKETLKRFFVAEEILTEDARFEVTLDKIDSNNITIPSRPVGEEQKIYLDYSIDLETTEVTLSLTGGHGISVSAVSRMLNRLLMTLYCPQRNGRAFLLPAERSGINLFFRELNSRRATLLRHVASQTLDTNELLKDIIVSRYPQPIHDYIEFMNSQPEIKRKDCEFSDMAKLLQKEVLRVRYKIDRYGDISITPMRGGKELGLHLGSSTVKTFFGLWSYLNHLARKGDWLMIDEPELNLHPSNQRVIARLLAQLVNRGIKVIVSTHSDYMVREWGNLIMLAEDFAERDQLAQKFGLPCEQWLSVEKVAAYEFQGGGAKQMEVTIESGIETLLFDDTIKRLNDTSQTIFYAKPQPSQQKNKKSKNTT